MRRRRVILAAGVAALLVVVGLLRWPRPAQVSRAPQAVATPPAPATLPAPAAADTPGVTPAATAAATAQRFTSVARAAAAEYRRRARYPRSSQPIDGGSSDPILQEREVSRNTFPGPGGRGPSLTVFPERGSSEHPDAVVLYAYLSEANKRVAAQRIEGEVVDAWGATVARLAYTDDGHGTDAAAGDALYTAEVPPLTLSAAPTGSYLVRVHAVTTTGEDRQAASGFLYSRPDAQLTGAYTDAVVGGHLQVQAEVAVQADGRFHLQATLYSQDGQPIAWAQNGLRLTPGVQQIPLTFYGLILREKAIDGPYVLRYVALSTTTGMPNAPNRLVENAYVTQAYAASTFSDQPFDDPNLLDTAARLERDGGLGGPQ